MKIGKINLDGIETLNNDELESIDGGILSLIGGVAMGALTVGYFCGKAAAYAEEYFMRDE